MLTALAHLILACSRSRSLIADSIRDEPEKWTVKGDGKFEHANGKVKIFSSYDMTYVRAYVGSDDYSGSLLPWSEARLVRSAAKALQRSRKHRMQRQFDKALKAALTGDE